MAENHRFLMESTKTTKKIFENKEEIEYSPNSPRSLARGSRFSSRDAEINDECIRERERERMRSVE